VTAPTTSGAPGAGPGPGSAGAATDQLAWQRQADLLADGREFLERWCRSTRFGHLYPEGPNFSILFESFQAFDRQRTVGRAPRSRWRQRRLLIRILHRAAKRDAFNRDQRIKWGYPLPAVSAIERTAMIDRALAQVDSDVQGVVAARLAGREPPTAQPDETIITGGARADRAINQFRAALTNEALANPGELVRLPAALWPLLASGAPHRRRHPVAMLVLIKFPLRLAVGLMTLLLVSYVGAWMVFNDAVLGRFVSTQVSGLVEGELEMSSIHWDLPLVVDLISGQPTEVVVEEVSVWEPYKSYGGVRKRRTAYAERLHATIVLHEIIPWNRLGIPRFLDIPWVLHFPTVTTTNPTWITVREYEDIDARGDPATLLSLIDAFTPLKSDPDSKGLSFAIDTATLSTTSVDIDIGGDEGWANATEFSWVNFSLGFDAPEPNSPPAVLPFAFNVEGFARVGALHVGAITVPYEDFTLEQLASGRHGVAAGDVGFSSTTNAAGSLLALRGGLSSVFAGTAVLPPMGVELSGETEDAGGIVAHMLSQLDLSPDLIDADAASLWVHLQGPISDPEIRMQADGLTIDALGESAWATDDVVVDLTLAPRPVPERWADRFAPGEEPLTVRIEQFSGATLDGTFALAEDTFATVIVPSDDDSPTLASADLTIAGLDPGRFFVADEALSSRLTGTLGGRVNMHELVLPPTGDPTADVELIDLSLTRDRGPADDGLPRRLGAQGRIAFSPTDGLDLDKVIVSTDGAQVSATGGLTADLGAFENLRVGLVVNDGRAFSRAFGLDAYFSGLRANLALSGSTGAPRAPPGRLVINNLGLFGSLPTAEPASERDRSTEASIWLERGVLRVHTDQARLLGGTGSLDLWVYLMEDGGLSSDPRIRGKARLRGVKPERATSGQITGLVDLDITLDDGNGRPASIDTLKVSGDLLGEKLRIAGTTYRDAEMAFTLTRDALEIERLVLPLHRGVSPFHGPNVTIPVGEIVAEGRVGLDSDPTLDLKVRAHGVGLDVVTRLLETDASVGGRIDRGTDVVVGGTLARPRIDGTVNLVGLAAGGVVLGGGALKVRSADSPPADGLAAHRLLEVEGVLAAQDTGNGPLEWTVDGLAAFGRAKRDGTAPIDAELDISLNRLSLRSLIGDPEKLGLPATVRGELTGLGAHITACAGVKPMLSACLSDASARSLQIDVDVEDLQLGQTTGGRPLDCNDATTLCSETRLDATLAWPVFKVERPWRLASGGAHPAHLAVSGSFDLSSGQSKTAVRDVDCAPPPLGPGTTKSALDNTQPHGQISGGIDLASLAPFFANYGISTAEGRIDLNLSLSGEIASPTIAGRATLASTGTEIIPLEISLGDDALPLSFPELDVRLDPGWITAVGRVEVAGEPLSFGTVRGEHTGVGFSGSCDGSWGLAAEGALSKKLLETLVGPGIVTKGKLALDRLVITGPGEDDDPLGRVEGTIRVGRDALSLELSEAVPTVEISSGRVDFARCRGEECGPTVDPGSIAVWVGGKEGAATRQRSRPGAPTVPKDALQARVGTRGQASVWGTAHLATDVSRAAGTELHIVLNDVLYRDYDGRGRPVYEMEVSSDELLLQGGDPLVLSGSVVADRARYVKDAVQGVEILALTDEIAVPEAPPPAIIRALQFDLRAHTDTPLRVENNIAHRVEASVALRVSGSYDAPELTGRFDVEPGGSVDIPFLTGTYEIQYGRVTLERDIADAEVDILALRNEPVYIENEAREIQLRLGGTVSAITWDCIAEGDASRAVETTRGCLDYLVLGAGDVQAGQSDVQRLGGGGLANARKSLQVVGHVTEFDFGERIAKAVPRYESFVPDVRLRLGQIGPELDVSTPPEWFDFDWAQARFGWDYTRGYPGLLLLQSRKLSFQLEILDPVTLEFSRDTRSYVNERIIFDPLRQRTIELRFDLSLPSLR